jgi:hypothetical protein
MAYWDTSGKVAVWVGEYHGEIDCGTGICLYWNSARGQWEPDEPPALDDGLLWYDLPGFFFTGFVDLTLNGQPSGAARMTYAVGGQLTGQASLAQVFKLGATWWSLRNVRFAQETASEAFGQFSSFAGRTVDDVAEALAAGRLSPSAIPVQLVVKEGTTFLVNTRSSAAMILSGAAKPLWTLVDATAEVGVNLRLAGQLARNPGAPTIVVRLKPSGRYVGVPEQ